MCCVCCVSELTQGTLLLNFKMDAHREKSLYCAVQNLELFSCNLASEQSTALSILDPVTINVELMPSDLQNSIRSVGESARSKALHDRMVQDAHTLKVRRIQRHMYTHAMSNTHTHTSSSSILLVP